MAEEFVPEFDLNSVPPNVSLNPFGSDRERLRVMLIGPAEYIRDMKLRLSQCGVAEVGSWSRLLPAPDTSEVMSILVLYRKRE